MYWSFELLRESMYYVKDDKRQVHSIVIHTECCTLKCKYTPCANDLIGLKKCVMSHDLRMFSYCADVLC